MLLDLYRSTAKTRNIVLDILAKIRDRIWLPYQAALEYQRNRLEVIARERAVYAELQQALNNLTESFKQKMHNHAIESMEQITVELERAASQIKEIIDHGAKEHPDLMKADSVREQLTKLFEGKVGAEYEEKQLADIYAKGAKRDEHEVPPGYRDAKKPGNEKFGDLVVWHEIMDYAKLQSTPVVFVTSDSKEDWWWRHGQFTVGPRPELVQEMMAVAEQSFYMYNLPRFMAESERNLQIQLGAADVKKAADELEQIETLRGEDALFKKLAAEERATVYRRVGDVLGSSPADPEYAEVRTKLTAIPSTQFKTISAPLLLEGIALHLRRAATSEEIDDIIKLVQSRAVDEWVSDTRTCWDVARIFAAYIVFRKRVEAEPKQ